MAMAKVSTSEVITKAVKKTQKSTKISPGSIKEGTLERLERLLKKSSPKLVGPEGEEIVLPEPLYNLLHAAVSALVNGEEFSIVPEDLLLSTSKAAKVLNVSRPYLIKLLDSGEIPSAPSVGTHRRVKAQDVVDYKKSRDENRSKSMKELSNFLQEEGFYDD
jgi:excisionase family DNA binding protein